MNPLCVHKSFNGFLFSDLTEDGPYGGTGGGPWTDINTFIKNGQITAMEIRASSLINAIRARYSIKVANTFSCKIY